MKIRLSIGLAPLLLILSALPAVPGAADVGAPFKGHTELNRTIHERILAAGATFDFGNYVGGDNQLLALLGTYQSNGLNQEFVNGAPNVLNTVLYHLVMSGLSGDIASLCDPTAGAKTPLGAAVSDDFRAALKPLCAWPAPSARTDDVLFAFYLSLMSYDAPEDDFQEWKQVFQGETFASSDSKQAVAAMSLTLLMNPYFLLQE